MKTIKTIALAIFAFAAATASATTNSTTESEVSHLELANGKHLTNPTPEFLEEVGAVYADALKRISDGETKVTSNTFRKKMKSYDCSAKNMFVENETIKISYPNGGNDSLQGAQTLIELKDYDTTFIVDLTETELLSELQINQLQAKMKQTAWECLHSI